MPLKSRELSLGRDFLRHEAQTCDWFLFSFRKIVSQIAAEHGVAIEINEAVLKEDFRRWHEFFTTSKEAVGANRREFIFYAAGLMARELLRSAPALKVTAEGAGPGALALWPEGYCIFRYCAEVAAAILEEEYGEHIDFHAEPETLPVWASLKENVQEDPRYAVPFLKRVMGEMPDWKRLDLPPAAPGARLAGPARARLLH